MQTVFLVNMSMLDMYLHVALRSISMAVQLGLIQNAELTLGEKTYCTCLICHPCLAMQGSASFSMHSETMNV